MYDIRHVVARWWFLALLLLPVGGCPSSGGESGGAAPPAPPAPSGAQLVAPDRVTVLEGSTATIDVTLSAAPDAPVTVDASVDSGSSVLSLEGPTQLQFDETNWDTPQTLTVRSASDEDTRNDWSRVRLMLGGGIDEGFVDVVQDDEQGTPISLDGVALTVKDVTGAGAVDYPVTAVVPLPYGKFQDTDGFRMLGPDGNEVPAQFEVLNRWWARDGSIRHVVAQFQATVPPDSEATYTFETTGGRIAPAKAVTVSQSGDVVTVDTGALRFKVRRDAFNLFDEVFLDTNGDGSYSASERIVASDPAMGGVFTGRLPGDVQREADRDDVKLVVEESGPMRAVLRVSGLTNYVSTEDHTHGFAVRIYAYAGKSFVKVDYQLQNSAKNVRHSWPLYFEDLSLHVKPSLSQPTLRLATGPGNVWSGPVGNGRYLFQEDGSKLSVRDSGNDSTLLSGSNEAGYPSYAWADLSDSDRGMFVAIRHMAEMWPNGIEVAGGNDVAVRLWPEWSAQWEFETKALSKSGLYWLEDMQHVLKEVVFWFHGPGVTDDERDDMARNFQSHPIPFVPTRWYAETAVTLDLDGIMPETEPTPGTDAKRLVLEDSEVDPDNDYYSLNWVNFGGDTGRRRAGGAGGWPNSAASVYGSERVDYWLKNEALSRDALNCRPQSMAEYSFEDDFDRLELVHNFSSQWWRPTDGPEVVIAAPRLDNTSWNHWTVRDNQHFWSYQVEEFYYLSANPWIRDWYEFQADFRLAERSQPGTSASHWHQEPTFSGRARGEAHSWGVLLQAYRVTGDARLLDRMHKRMERSVLANRKLRYGVFNETDAAPFQLGFFGRVMIQLMTEVRGYDPQLHDQAFQIVWGIVDWNHNLANYTYYVDSTTVVPGAPDSGGTSTTIVDPVAWFALRTGNEVVLDRLRKYMTEGLNGGRTPYGDPQDWSEGFDGRGGYLGRAGEYAMKYGISPNPPAAITDLSASWAGGKVRIEWTTPQRADRFHVVWADKPFTENYERSETRYSPWAGTPVGNTLQAIPGTKQSLSFDGAPAGTTVYVAVFTFDDDSSAMSRMSNVASVAVP